VNCLYTLCPERIVVGGGVASQPGLLPRVRTQLASLLRGYGVPDGFHADAPAFLEGFLVAPSLGSRSGVLGALALAQGGRGALTARPGTPGPVRGVPGAGVPGKGRYGSISRRKRR